METEVVEKEVKEVKEDRRKENEKGFVPFEVFTFEELEDVQEAQETAQEISEAGWELQLLTENIVVSPNISPDKMPSALTKLAKSFGKKINELLGKKKDLSGDGFKVIKGKDGKYYWISIYSNNALDDDSPQEIISSKSHKNFAALVDSGEVPYPELWLWHTKEWNIGKSNWVAYDEENGIAMAAGYFHDYALPVAKALEGAELLVSHGMYGSSIVKEGNTINAHVTYEISPLPTWAAANKFTGFVILNKEATMLSESKRQSLVDSVPGLNLGDVEAIENANVDTSKKIDEAGVERKEKPLEDEVVAETPEVEEEAPVAEPVVEAEEVIVEVEVEVEETVLEEIAESGGPIFTEAQAAELKETFEAFGVGLVAQITESFNEAVKGVAEVREKETAEIIQETPMSSLKDILGFGDPVTKAMSASRSDETIVDGRKSLARDKPEENKEFGTDIIKSGDPVIQEIVGGVFNFQELMNQDAK